MASDTLNTNSDMAKDPAILFYTADFLNGVAELTMEERGIYITLLCHQHQHGKINTKRVGLFLGLEWVSLSDDLRGKFDVDGNGYATNARMTVEIGKRHKFLNRQYVNGSKGGRPKNPRDNPRDNPQGNPQGNPNKTLSLLENDNIDDITTNGSCKVDRGGMGEKDLEEFEKVWLLYGRKGNRKTSLERWVKLSVRDRALCFKHIPPYVESTPDPKYRKNFEVYLNRECWNDEVVVKTATIVKDNAYYHTKTAFS